MKYSTTKNLLEAYRKGFSSSTFSKPPVITTNVRKLIKEFSLQYLSNSQSIIFDQSTDKRQLSLQKARENKIEDAINLYEELEKLSESVSSTPVIKLLIKAQNYPVIAYIEYEQDNFQKALELLEQGAHFDYLLETEYHFFELQFHRLHLYFNQSKVMIRQQEYKNAFEVLLKMLDQIADPKTAYFNYPFSNQLNQSNDDLIKILYLEIAQLLVRHHNAWPKSPSLAEPNSSTLNQYQTATDCIKNGLQSSEVYSQEDWVLLLSQGNQYMGDIWIFLIIKAIRYFNLSKTDPSFYQTILSDFKDLSFSEVLKNELNSFR